MERVVVRGSGLLKDGEPFIIKGVSIPDYFWLLEREKQEACKVISIIKELGFNTVRIPVLPGHLLFYDDYIKGALSNMVRECKDKGLCCVIDWHAIGNPLASETRLKEYFHEKDGEKIYWYCADKELARKGWRLLAEQFGDEPNVIFELFNEPAPGEKALPQQGLSPLRWENWREEAIAICKEIRDLSPNLIIISPTSWSFDLDKVAESPIEEITNIAYSFHHYPIKKHSGWENMLESSRGLPVIVTEFGYDTDEKSTYFSSKGSYLSPFTSYLRKNGISWIGWCFSASWRPRIIKSWTPFELSDFGENLVKELR